MQRFPGLYTSQSDFMLFPSQKVVLTMRRQSCSQSLLVLGKPLFVSSLAQRQVLVVMSRTLRHLC